MLQSQSDQVWIAISYLIFQINTKCTIADLGGVGVAGAVLVTHLGLLSLPRLPPTDLLDNFLGHVLGSCFWRYVYRHFNNHIYNVSHSLRFQKFTRSRMSHTLQQWRSLSDQSNIQVVETILLYQCLGSQGRLEVGRGNDWQKWTLFKFPPKSYVMVQYKTFDITHYIVFVKKRPATGQITFCPTP